MFYDIHAINVFTSKLFTWQRTKSSSGTPDQSSVLVKSNLERWSVMPLYISTWNLHERLFTLSDSLQMHVCRKCQNVRNVIEKRDSNGKKIRRQPYFRLCQSTDDMVRVSVSYGAKLLCQELFCMGINLKFDTNLC